MLCICECCLQAIFFLHHRISYALADCICVVCAVYIHTYMLCMRCLPYACVLSALCVSTACSQQIRLSQFCVRTIWLLQSAGRMCTVRNLCVCCLRCVCICVVYSMCVLSASTVPIPWTLLAYRSILLPSATFERPADGKIGSFSFWSLQ